MSSSPESKLAAEQSQSTKARSMKKFTWLSAWLPGHAEDASFSGASYLLYVMYAPAAALWLDGLLLTTTYIVQLLFVACPVCMQP